MTADLLAQEEAARHWLDVEDARTLRQEMDTNALHVTLPDLDRHYSQTRERDTAYSTLYRLGWKPLYLCSNGEPAGACDRLEACFLAIRADGLCLVEMNEADVTAEQDATEWYAPCYQSRPGVRTYVFVDIGQFDQEILGRYHVQSYPLAVDSVPSQRRYAIVPPEDGMTWLREPGLRRNLSVAPAEMRFELARLQMETL